MTILEFPKDDLLALSDVQLEQLIGRLAEAEVSAYGASVADVRFSGSITAPDGGVDVRVVISSEPFKSGFISRTNTVFQSKKHSMPAGAIAEEMKPKGVLSAVIGQLCEGGGAYVIVSLDDDCTDTMRTARLAAMKAAVADQPEKDEIYFDFFDRSKLHQWLRQHPGVLLWVRSVLGKPLSGWQPYGQWSYVPVGGSDSLIEAPGISVVLPLDRHQKLTIAEALTPTRQMIADSNKAIRVAGLSGVGKTRFVQALFDEKIGADALDRTTVIYADTGANPIPSARQMIDQLIETGKQATVVIDNCPNDLHTDLASRISSSRNRIRLITVEYDIRDDKPLTTEMVHIEADGPEVAEALILRRHPAIGHANARRVAEFAGGNTRVALAVAERVGEGESLAQLTDANLFDRLFQQRHGEDGRLREHAEILSLVYSFSVEPEDGEPDELAVLASLCNSTGDALFRSAQDLAARQIAQKRGQWRAILPHAIANRLTASALDRMRAKTLRATFEYPPNHRLLASFAHRLGLMHDHPVAQNIVRSWLAEDGILVPVTALDDEKAKVLDFIAPVCPDLLLDRIEAEISAKDFPGFEIHNPRRTAVLQMLVSLAYDRPFFDRCIRLLLTIAQQEDPKNNYDSVRDKITSFFQPYLSGTHATLEQRAAVLKEALWSADPYLRGLGTEMLSKTLDGPPWMGMGMGEFGARPRDFGYEPNYDQLVAWRHLFIGIALEAGLSSDQDLSGRARGIIAQEFRGLWADPSIQAELTKVAIALNAQSPWTDGWKSVLETIYFDYRDATGPDHAEPVPPELLELRENLTPKDLVSSIRAHLLGRRNDLWSLDPDFDHDDQTKYAKAEARLAERVTEFGKQFALAGNDFKLLGPELFSADWMPYGHAFGSGIARGAPDLTTEWEKLVAALRDTGLKRFNAAVLSGFLEEAGQLNQGLDRHLLDVCLKDDLLRPAVRLLHPARDFADGDMDRCIYALQHPDVAAWSFGDLLWRDVFEAVSQDRRITLAKTILSKPNGDEVLLDALSMRLHGKDKTLDILGPELRRMGILASIGRLGAGKNENSSSLDHAMSRVLSVSLGRDGNDAEKLAWLDAIFASVDTHYGYAPDIEDALQVTVAVLPEEFLNRAFMGTKVQKQRRSFFLGQRSHRKSLLGTADVARIINWCRAMADPTVWEGVASGLDLFAKGGDENAVAISEQAVRFLEACPAPELVLGAYTRKISPDGWSGSRAAIMERNVNAFGVFVENSDMRIAAAARKVVAEAAGWVARERERELSTDAKREQRFE